jgi:hypothetical protein
MLLVLKFERLMLNYHRFFDKNLDFFLQKKCKNMRKSQKVFNPYPYEITIKFKK